jgi:hypothetical protein
MKHDDRAPHRLELTSGTVQGKEDVVESQSVGAFVSLTLRLDLGQFGLELQQSLAQAVKAIRFVDTR